MIRAAEPALVEDAKIFAALSAVYDPIDALPEPVRNDPTHAVLVASVLAMASDTNPDTGSGWLLRSGERHHILDSLQRSGRLATAIEDRRSGPLDPATTDLLDALAGEGLFAPDRLTSAITDPNATPAEIERIATALDRADSAAPGRACLMPARIRLAELAEEGRRATVAARGFFGRVDEQTRLFDWLSKPASSAPVKAALITGSPGIGKSALLDAVTRDAVDRQGAIVVRLDFDRAGLDILDLRGLTMEIARQLAERIGAGAERLLDARLAAARVDGTARYEGSTRALIPERLSSEIGNAVNASGRRVLLVLDTLEVLRARGERHVAQLFDWIDRLVSAGMKPLSVLAAGRGNVFDGSPERCGEWITLHGLDPEAAEMLLERLEVPPEMHGAVLDIANGCPLVMRLAARVIGDHGSMPLPRRRLDGEVMAGFLYRFLLSRITDPDLRRLAHPGMIARRLSADFLREVLAPQLGLKGLVASRAQALFDALAAEHWLVERDPLDPLFVRHRGDMRALLLPMLYRSRPGQCARIDAAAARWFGRRHDTESHVDSAYHSLQLMRSRKHAPMVEAGIAQRFEPATIAELPDVARSVLDRARGGRTASFRGEYGVGEPTDEDAVEVLRHLVDAGDWEEGGYVVDQIRRGGLDPRSIVADAVRTFHWRAGHWETAWQMLAERDRLRDDNRDLETLPGELVVARLEMRAEFTPRNLADVDFEEWVFGTAEFASGERGLVHAGALGFLRAARRRTRETSWGKDGDPVAAAWAQWTEQADPAREFAFGRARDRLRARGLSADDAGWDEPQLLATLTPYAEFVATISTQDGRSDLNLAARTIESRLARAGALMGQADLSVSESNPIAGIADLGLFAEWAGVAAMASADPNLRRIARSAERWRRTVAGDWNYGRPPAEWRHRQPVDRSIAGRIEALLQVQAPRQAALAQLALWSADGDGERLWRVLRKRFPATLAQSATIHSPAVRAKHLLRRLPAAFVPPVAILIEPQPGVE